MGKTNLQLIVALDKNNGIGNKGDLPWRLKKDLAYFKEITCKTKDPLKKNILIMGRKTWDSIPETVRPLPNRINMVITSGDPALYPKGVLVARSLEDALVICSTQKTKSAIESIFVIGGASVYNTSIELKETTKLFITRIQNEFKCDTHFPRIPEEFIKKSVSIDQTENDIHFNFEIYEK
jgi:dihydrofolate reductase